MGTVVLPNPLTAHTKAEGAHVLGNDQAITAQVNSNLDDANYKNAGMTLSAKAVPGSATNSVLGADSVTADKVADQAIQAEHLKNEAGPGSTGIGAPRNELFSESDQAAIAGNVIAGRQQQGGKIVTAYFKITATGTSVLIDDSIDWRRRIITIVATVNGNAGGPANRYLPNGADDNFINGAMWNAAIAAFGNANTGIFYSEAGRADGGGNPALVFGWSAVANTSLAFYALDTDGGLKCRSNASLGGGGNTELDICATIICGPYIGV